jgi:hypothetical protein
VPFRPIIKKGKSMAKMKKPYVKLTGEDGNAFLIIGKCLKAMRKAGWSVEQIDKFQTDATSGDYDHLLATVMKYCEVE